MYKKWNPGVTVLGYAQLPNLPVHAVILQIFVDYFLATLHAASQTSLLNNSVSRTLKKQCWVQLKSIYLKPVYGHLWIRIILLALSLGINKVLKMCAVLWDFYTLFF